ncbi:MAG: hypothetical protein SF187_10200 [Deltaproteobacteria bacterium]|nr:hypothetical protein [Deltaproteobacteria bacterium]
MISRSSRVVHCVLAAVALLPCAQAGAVPAKAQAPAATRSVDQIVADFIAASGGTSPWKKHKSLFMSMQLEVRGLGLTGTATALWTNKGEYLETGDLPNMLTMKRGGDGKRFWSQDPIDGLRWLSGAEAEQALTAGSWMGYLRLLDHTTGAKVVAAPAEKLECIEVTYKAGAPTTFCFDTTSHLLLLEQGKKASPQGDTPYTTRASDYRSFGGVMFPYTQETTAGPATFVVTIVNATWDVPTKAAQFALPKPAKSASAK